MRAPAGAADSTCIEMGGRSAKATEPPLRAVPSSRLRRIVVLRPNHRLGNALLLTPLLRELAERLPTAAVDLVTTGGAGVQVFERFPNVATIHCFPRRSFRRPDLVLGRLIALRRERYDLAIDPVTRSRAARLLLEVVNARDRIGFSWGSWVRDRRLTLAVDAAAAPALTSQVPLYLLRCALPATSDDGPCDDSHCSVQHASLDLCLSEAERKRGKEAVRSALGCETRAGRECIGLFANATGSKCFPVPWWRALIAMLRAQDSTRTILEIIPEDGRARLPECPGLYTPDLRLLGAALATLSLVVAADCGVMHLANASGTRVLGLFRATDPARYRPCGPTGFSMMVGEGGCRGVAERIFSILGNAGGQAR